MWGSPPSPDFLSGKGRRQRTLSITTADGSPSSRVRNCSSEGPISLQEREASSGGRKKNHFGLLSRQRKSVVGIASPLGQRYSRHEFTADWLNTNLVDFTNTERGNWWSDESEKSEDPSPGRSAREASPYSDSAWLHFSGISPKVGISTVTPDRRIERIERRKAGKLLIYDKNPARVKVQQRNGSEMSQDLLEFLGDQSVGDTGSLGLMPGEHTKTKDATSSVMARLIEKPLPPIPPPFDRTASEAPITNNAVSPVDVSLNSSRPSPVAQSSFQRARKRIVWRGKACIIALPLDDDSQNEGAARDYLKRQDVEDRLEMWKSQGYNTKGFSLSSTDDVSVHRSSEGQSCAIYPNPEDERKEPKNKCLRVSIPDRREWENYVNMLKEDKLRALGVSVGGEDTSVRHSPSLSLMSRHASSQSSAFPISPRLAACSMANTHSSQHLNPYSGQFPGSTVLGTHASVIPNAVHQQVKPGTSHLSRYSVAIPHMEKGLPPPCQFPPAQSPLLGSWSPQQQFFMSHPSSRVTSPPASGNMLGFSNTLPPLAISVMDHGGQSLNQNASDLLPHMRQKQAQIQPQLLYQQNQQHHLLHPQLQETATGAPNPVEPSQLPGYSKQPEIVTPIPRGHRQNLSETLQKEVDEAELHLQQSEGRVNIESEKHSTYDIEARDGHEDELPVLENILRVINKDFDCDDLDTNPSLSGTPQADRILFETGQPAHLTKSSLSKLNVNAPEFVFEPKKSLTSDVFAFLGNRDASQKITNEAALPSPISQLEHAPQTSPGKSNFNVAAPAFTPATAPIPGVPSRVFSFSPKGPSFNPDTPSFQPTGTSTSASDLTASSGGSGGKKIFGDLKLSETVKPTKKSRAIPIMKPDEFVKDLDLDADGQEDESGRITQADGRQKRLRRGDDDSDQVPLFANQTPVSPSYILGVVPRTPEKSPRSLASNHGNTPTMEKASNSLKILDDLPGSQVVDLMDDNKIVHAENKPWEPFAFPNALDAAIFNAARSNLPSPGPPLSDNPGLFSNLVEGIPQNNTVLFPSSGYTDGQANGISGTIRNLELDLLLEPNQIDYTKPSTISRGTLVEDGKISSHSSRNMGSGSLHSVTYSTVSRSHQNGPTEKLREEPHHRETNLGGEPDVFGAAALDVTYLEQSYNEIDAVMKHLNEEDSDLGVERKMSPWSHRSPIQTPLTNLHNAPGVHQLLPVPHVRSDAPSPSPNRLKLPFQYLPESDSESPARADIEMVAHNARFSPSYRPSNVAIEGEASVHRLNSPGNLPISDWDDVISSGDEFKLRASAGFFDQRIGGLVGGIVQQRLSPLEKALAAIQSSLLALSSRSASRRHQRSLSGEVEHSDADDEDDLEDTHSLVKSPVRDRRYDKRKASITETNGALENFASAAKVAEILEVVKDMKTSMQRPWQSSGEIKTVVEEAVARQLRGRSGPITSSHESATAEKNQLQIAGLESMLKIADARADDELQARRATEDALADSQRLLRMAMQEAAEQRESAEETERSLAAFHDERQQVLRRNAVLEGAQESMQKSASDLAEKNAALESTLEEYRLSSSQWRDEVEEAKTENNDLRRTITALKAEIEDSIRGRQTLRAKFDRLQEGMTLTSRDIARDQSIWRRREEDMKSRVDQLDETLKAESRTREKLEHEIVELVAQEREAANVRHSLEQGQQENARLKGLVDKLRTENDGHQKSAARYECELHNARESAKMEIHRTRTASQAEVEDARAQLDRVRSDLEANISRLKAELDGATADANSTKARHHLMLEEASDSRNTALREAAEAREAALQEHYRFHQRTLDEAKAQHERALKIVQEDKERFKIHLNSGLDLANEKVLHLQDKVSHLEEKLEIAKAAAQQLVAQSKKADSSPSANRASISHARGSDIPERISPQALRESIMVLQEQLQEREARIEELEQEHLTIDKDAPAKLKDQEIEITWLRELLGVRIDDLEDIITTVSQPSYDRVAVRDAAIRLKANLQMEQQEKERALAGGQSFPSLASISTLTSSPRALPLAAAAAWGNWRKARDMSFGSLAGMTSGSPSETPSRASPSAASFLSGLLTPPGTKTRQTHQPDRNPGAPRPTSATSVRSGGAYRTPRQSISLSHYDEDRPLRVEEPPATPTLMREASYDRDAESTEFGEGGEDGSEAGAYFGGKDDAREGPFGPDLNSFSKQLPG